MRRSIHFASNSTLRTWMVEIPARSTVDRLVSACSSSGEDAMWQRVKDRLTPEFCIAVDKAARAFVDGLETNPFAKLRDNALEISRRDAIAEPDAVRELRRVVETHLPRIRIEDLLIEVDSWCGFTQAL